MARIDSASSPMIEVLGFAAGLGAACLAGYWVLVLQTMSPEELAKYRERAAASQAVAQNLTDYGPSNPEETLDKALRSGKVARMLGSEAYGEEITSSNPGKENWLPKPTDWGALARSKLSETRQSSEVSAGRAVSSAGQAPQQASGAENPLEGMSPFHIHLPNGGKVEGVGKTADLERELRLANLASRSYDPRNLT